MHGFVFMLCVLRLSDSSVTLLCQQLKGLAVLKISGICFPVTAEYWTASTVICFLSALRSSFVFIQGDFLLNAWRTEPATVYLGAFYRLACAHFCKATALLQIPRFAFRLKSREINSSTCQIKIFWRGEVEERSNTTYYK